MPAASYDLEIEAGGTTSFTVDVIGGPASLSGYVGSMMIRELRDDPVPLKSVGPSAINIDAVNRQVTVTIPSVDTSTYDFRRGVYDLRIVGPDADAWILVEGRVEVSRAVTRED